MLAAFKRKSVLPYFIVLPLEMVARISPEIGSNKPISRKP
jgi:hypothetical protein